MRRKSTDPSGWSSPAGGGTVRTGQGALRSTFSVTDPRTQRSKPPRPWVPITITSAGQPRARSRISWTTRPSRTDVSTRTPVPAAGAASPSRAAPRRPRTAGSRMAHGGYVAGATGPGRSGSLT